jgi:catechol 2,3-dioxygenase-like lactoylglutathione lyase family enzyme
MSLLHVEGVTHWSIPVNNLEEAEAFYGDLLGLTPVGRLGNSRMSCFTAGEHHILLCERAATVDHTFVEDPKVHHAFTVSPETLVRACKVFRERQIRIEHLYHRQEGVFPGRELSFFDPSVSGCVNMLENRPCESVGCALGSRRCENAALQGE